jgi:phosphate starvation-inducible PhoH-like protein
MSKHNHKKKKHPVVEEIELENILKEPEAKSFKLNIKQFNFTEKQKSLIKLGLNKDTKIIFISGPSGSSKTLLAVYLALRAVSEDPNVEVKYVRTIAESAEKSLGALPGNSLEKLSPFLMPLLDKLEELLPPQQIKHLIDQDIIEGLPINHVRGASWRNKIAIFDESQSSSVKELITMITRIGENSKLLILGDPMQSDIGNKSGFQTIYNLFNTPESVAKGIHCFEFFEEDIMRSEILKYIVSVFKKLPNQNNGNGKYQI